MPKKMSEKDMEIEKKDGKSFKSSVEKAKARKEAIKAAYNKHENFQDTPDLEEQKTIKKSAKAKVEARIAKERE
jgi:hypothetical protein